MLKAAAVRCSALSASGDGVSCNLRPGLAGEPGEAALGEEMTRWFEIAANPLPALFQD